MTWTGQKFSGDILNYLIEDMTDIVGKDIVAGPLWRAPTPPEGKQQWGFVLLHYNGTDKLRGSPIFYLRKRDARLSRPAVIRAVADRGYLVHDCDNVDTLNATAATLWPSCMSHMPGLSHSTETPQ
jgi:hypothetical protein